MKIILKTQTIFHWHTAILKAIGVILIQSKCLTFSVISEIMKYYAKLKQRIVENIFPMTLINKLL